MIGHKHSQNHQIPCPSIHAQRRPDQHQRGDGADGADGGCIPPFRIAVGVFIVRSAEILCIETDDSDGEDELQEAEDPERDFGKEGAAGGAAGGAGEFIATEGHCVVVVSDGGMSEVVRMRTGW